MWRWIRQIFCEHVLETETMNRYRVNKKTNENDLTAVLIFERCPLCGWHRTYRKFEI